MAGVSALLAAATPGAASADRAHIAGVELTRRPYGRWSMVLEIEHEDVDRTHFCDRVEAIDQDGRRVFQAHFYEPRPKDVEEDGPVRRRVKPVPLPKGVLAFRLRARCKLSGWGGEPLAVDLSKASGPGYRVTRRDYRYTAHLEGIERHPELRTWRKKYLAWEYRGGALPRLGPVSPVPPDPVDTRPRRWRNPKKVRYPPGRARD